MTAMTAVPSIVPVRSERRVSALSHLRPRELEALRTYAETGNQDLAAHQMGISLQTFKNHTTMAYRVLDVTSAIDAFRAMGWLVPGYVNPEVRLADIEARLAAIHADSGALLAELRREVAA